MKDAYQFYLDCLDKINKEDTGYFDDKQFTRLANNASSKVFGSDQRDLQNPGTARLRKQEIEDRLFPFLKVKVISLEGGIFLAPDDYRYYSTCRMASDDGEGMVRLNLLRSQLCDAETDPLLDTAEIEAEIERILNNPDYVTVELLDQTQIVKRLTSYIFGKRPTKNKPVMERHGSADADEGISFEVHPNMDGQVMLRYYRLPRPGKLVMTVDEGTEELIYDEPNSVGFEWVNEDALSDIALQVAKDFAIYVREKDLFQMTEVEKTKK